jgi:ABC-type antimicrobial peptide transport system permease subunit
MRDPVPRVFYVPIKQYPLQNMPSQNMLYYYVLTAIDPQQVAPLIRRELASIDPNIPIREMKMMEAQLEENLFIEHLLSRLTSLFAGLATLLAAIGLYGVLAYTTAKRTREIGIRIALGAQRNNILKLVVGQGLRLTFLGVALGLAASYWLTQLTAIRSRSN